MGKKLTYEEINKITDDIVSFDMKEADTEMFLKYVTPLPSGSKVVELGTGQAKNTVRIALSNPEVEVWTWDWGHGNPDTFPAPYFKMITDRLREKNVANVYFSVNDSDKAWSDWDWPIDILYIDASHQYEETLKDLARWEPFVKQGGYIFIHDYEYNVPNYKFAGMRKAVQEYCTTDKFEFLEYVGGIQVIKKL